MQPIYVLWYAAHAVLLLAFWRPLRLPAALAAVAMIAVCLYLKDDTYDKITYVAYLGSPWLFSEYGFESGFRFLAENWLLKFDGYGKEKYEILTILGLTLTFLGLELNANRKFTATSFSLSCAFFLTSIYTLSAGQIFFRQFLAFSLVPLAFYLFSKSRNSGYFIGGAAPTIHVSSALAIFGSFALSKFRSKASRFALTSAGLVVSTVLCLAYMQYGDNQVLTDGTEGGTVSEGFKVLSVMMLYAATTLRQNAMRLERDTDFLNMVFTMKTMLICMIFVGYFFGFYGLVSRIVLIYLFYESCHCYILADKLRTFPELISLLLYSALAPNAINILKLS